MNRLPAKLPKGMTNSTHPPYESLCDACSQTVPADEAQTCEHCGGTYCERHIGDLDHSCTGDDSRDSCKRTKENQ